MKINMRLCLAALITILASNICFSQHEQLKEHVLFYSSFDGELSAEVAEGDPMIYTAENYKKVDSAQPGLHNPDVILAKGKGLSGDALHFTKKNTSAIFYKAFNNVNYSRKSWSGSVSFWLQVDPENDLAPGYCDPICITDAKYNDAAFWVDFTDGEPREFRLGAMGDLSIWNPTNESNDAEWKKRTVVVKEPPFDGEEWTHVIITYSEINTNKAESKLYLNGQFIGVVKGINDPFTWEAENGKIMLGLGYIGLMDDLSTFDKTLDQKEVTYVFGLKDGLKVLFE